MKIYGFVLALMFPLCALAQSQEAPWETVAINGITLMNMGNGDDFVKTSHTDFQKTMRNFLLSQMKQDPESQKTRAALKTYGVKTIDELQSIPLDNFISRTITYMHQSVPPKMRSDLENAKYHVVSSRTDRDSYIVTVRMDMNINGAKRSQNTALRITKEDGIWKYNGEAIPR